MYVGEEKR